MTPITKTCKQNPSHQFTITDEDQKFYEQMGVPPPTLCPDCRQQRRLAFRNERKLYNRKCDLTGKQIISIYSPDKPYKVYDQEEWWSDKWDPLDYGRDFDFNRPFFDQFRELQLAVPRVSVTNTNSENSEYTNYTANNKNCYLIFSNSYGHNEDCYYGTCLSKSKNCVDSINIFDCELTFDCIDCTNCYHLVSSRNCFDCSDSYFLSDCRRCKHCIACKGLRDKQYCIQNKQYTKEQYETFFDQSQLHTHTGYQKVLEFFNDFDQKTPHLFSRQHNCEDCTGDYLQNSKNCHLSFDTNKSENCRYLQYSVSDDVSCYDSSYLVDSQFCYENLSLVQCNRSLFTNLTWWGVHDVYYCDLCFNNAHNLFGCVGLRKKEYCILNKQYSKGEYEQLVPKIIEHMKKTGEWGEFFPISLSPFGYNETIAQEYFPLTKELALKLSITWKEEDVSNRYEGPLIQVSDNIEDVTEEITKQILTCNTCHHNYKIISQELRFYQNMKLPVPYTCPDCRHKARLSLRNPRKLWDRKCMKCGTDIKTSYAPDRKEIVYCERCYNESIY